MDKAQAEQAVVEAGRELVRALDAMDEAAGREEGAPAEEMGRLNDAVVAAQYLVADAVRALDAEEPVPACEVDPWRRPVADFQWWDRPYTNAEGKVVSSVRVGLNDKDDASKGWWARGWIPEGGGLWSEGAGFGLPFSTMERAMERADEWLRGEGAKWYRERVRTTYTDVDAAGRVVGDGHPARGMRLVDCEGYREGVDIGVVR